MSRDSHTNTSQSLKPTQRMNTSPLYASPRLQLDAPTHSHSYSKEYSLSLALMLHPHMLGCAHTSSHSILCTVILALTLPHSPSPKRTHRDPAPPHDTLRAGPAPSNAPLPLPHNPHTTSASIHARARYYGLSLRILASFRKTRGGMYTPVVASLRRIRGNASRLSPLPVLFALPPSFLYSLFSFLPLCSLVPLLFFLLSSPISHIFLPYFPSFSTAFSLSSSFSSSSPPPLLSLPSLIPNPYPSPSSSLLLPAPPPPKTPCCRGISGS